MLPNTTPNNYLTGMTALNVPTNEGTGDWHFIQTFQSTEGHNAGPYVVAGVDTIDVTAVLGLEGIIECSGTLAKYQAEGVHGDVYTASHYRAVAVMIVNSASKGWRFQDSYNLQDWFSGDEEKGRIEHYLLKAVAVLNQIQKNEVLAWFNVIKL